MIDVSGLTLAGFIREHSRRALHMLTPRDRARVARQWVLQALPASNHHNKEG